MVHEKEVSELAGDIIRLAGRIAVLASGLGDGRGRLPSEVSREILAIQEAARKIQRRCG